MDEFSLIDTYFKSIPHHREDVIFGIGDDAACLQVPEGMQLLVSCDTLVADVHFLSSWDAYDIASKAVRVNVSDIAAMGGVPCWLTLALTMPKLDEPWLKRFSQGLRDTLCEYDMALIGGDTTCGPLSLTITVHGLIPAGKAVRRNGAAPGDKIYVSGALGAAALAVENLTQKNLDVCDIAIAMKQLLHPQPRVDLSNELQSFATAAIDISDGLSADLNHICEESGVGACIQLDKIPVHPLVKKYQGKNALDFALSGGDDYELCFTVSQNNEVQLLKNLAKSGLMCYCIGVIEEELGLRLEIQAGEIMALTPRGYNHFYLHEEQK